MKGTARRHRFCKNVVPTNIAEPRRPESNSLSLKRKATSSTDFEHRERIVAEAALQRRLTPKKARGNTDKLRRCAYAYISDRMKTLRLPYDLTVVLNGGTENLATVNSSS